MAFLGNSSDFCENTWLHQLASIATLLSSISQPAIIQLPASIATLPGSIGLPELARCGAAVGCQWELESA